MKESWFVTGIALATVASIFGLFGMWPLAYLLGLHAIGFWLSGVGERIAELFEMPKGEK